MEKTNKIIDGNSDMALLEKIGAFIKAVRLQQNKTQQEIAAAAGINRSTLVSMENGGGGTLLSLVQVLRALNQLHLLEAFTAMPQVSPLLLAKMEQQQRKRASGTPQPGSETETDW
jgi:transcriptional regulator with XRE-family HTH domain